MRRINRAYKLGVLAMQENKTKIDNPFLKGTSAWIDWRNGWVDRYNQNIKKKNGYQND